MHFGRHLAQLCYPLGSNWQNIASLLASFLIVCSKVSLHMTSAQDWTFASSGLLRHHFYFFEVNLMSKMQLWGTFPNANRCTGGAPNRASGLQVLHFSFFVYQLFGRVAFGDSLCSFWNSLAIISIVLGTILDQCWLPPAYSAFKYLTCFEKAQGHANCTI